MKQTTAHVLTLLLLLALLPLAAGAQHRGIIASAESGLPLRDCIVYANTGETDTTQWTGEYALSSNFTSVTIVKSDFLSYTLERSEMTDTLYLLPKFNTLAEVTVWGRHRPISKSAISSWQPSFIPNTPATGGIGGLNILGIFEPRHGLSKKQQEKHDEVIHGY